MSDLQDNHSGGLSFEKQITKDVFINLTVRLFSLFVWSQEAVSSCRYIPWLELLGRRIQGQAEEYLTRTKNPLAWI